MTREEAESLKLFSNPCTCGGYAWTMNGRGERQPHMDYCPRHDEHAEWWAALHEEPQS